MERFFGRMIVKQDKLNLYTPPISSCVTSEILSKLNALYLYLYYKSNNAT